MIEIGNDWDEILEEEVKKDYYKNLRKFLIEEYNTKTIYPDKHDIFNALKASSYKDTKVVILGQDPYHEEGQAHGLAFSVQKGIKWPPSLVNIFKELELETGISIFTDENKKRFSGKEKARTGENNLGTFGCLTRWAKQGVLLLTTTLTVRAGNAGSHRGHGWEEFTDFIIKSLDRKDTPTVFILWGKNAREKKSLIKSGHHLIIEGAHPSPLSAYRGFWNGAYFTRTNEFLTKNALKEIDWKI